MSFKSFAAFAALALLPVSASAAATLVTTQSDDAAFEGAGGFLQTYYGLPLVGNTALPPLERAVGQVKTGTNTRRGLHTPVTGSGLPTPAGTGVTQALTNFGAFAGGSDANFSSGVPVAFTFSRVGTTITYTVGSTSWSDTKAYYADVNGLEARIRSNVPTAGTPTNSHDITNLVLTDAVTVAQSLGSLNAADGAVAIKLWSGLTGDFTLSGSYVFAWTGSQPTGARLASQIKLLALPAVPEPGTWVLMIGGFGLVGAAMRRRGALTA